MKALRRPRRLKHVGIANPVVVAGFRTLPAVFDTLVTPLMRTFALDSWRGLPPTPGNVEDAQHSPPGQLLLKDPATHQRSPTCPTTSA